LRQKSWSGRQFTKITFPQAQVSILICAPFATLAAWTSNQAGGAVLIARGGRSANVSTGC